jgi:hypothetical protein
MHTMHWAGWEKLKFTYKFLRKVQLGAQLQLQLLAQHHDARVRAARRLLAAVCSGLPRKQPEGRQRGRAVLLSTHSIPWHCGI